MPGTTSPPTCPRRRRRSLHPGTLQPVGPGRPRAALPDGADPPGGLDRARRSRSRSRCATSTGSGGRRRSSARAPRAGAPDARAHLLQVRGRQRRPGATSRTRPSRRPSTTRKRASSASRPRRAPGNGDRRSPSRARSSASRSTSSWCASRTTRSRTGARSWRRFGARCVAEPVRRRRASAARCSPSTRTSRAASASPSPRRSKQAAQRDDTKYALGSVLNHVLLHQTVIGQEAIAQMDLADDYPDVARSAAPAADRTSRGSCSRSSAQQLRGGADVRVIAVEPAACPSLTRGELRLRLRRHRPPDAAREDAHARVDVHPAGLPRRRAPLPRDGPAREPPPRARASSRRAPTTRPPCSRRASVRAHRGHPARARGEPRREGGDRRGAPLQEEGVVGDDPLQPVRPRPLRHAGATSTTSRASSRTIEYDEGELAMALAALPAVAV